MGGRRGLSARSGHQPHRPIGDLRLLPYMTADFTVSATQRGLVLSAFSWSYALMQIPAGSLINGFGERIMVGASACLWSICTGLTFLASGFGTLFDLRPGLGIGEAGAHPACTRGHPNTCRHRTAFGYQLDGGLPQHVRIPADARRNLVPVNNVPPLEAAIVEPVSCALNGQNPAEVAGARTILVAGAGPLGPLRMRLARVQGSPRSSRSNRTRPGTRSPGRPAPTPSRPRAATSRTGSGTSPRRGSTSSSWRSDAPRP